ncbi:MAG: LolA family protein [Streptosporangiaceae bacterium]
MGQRRPFGLRPWWALPGGALVVAGAVLAGTVLASAAAPALPRQTPAQLLVAMHRAKPPSAMIATVSQSANLGFPALPDIGGMDSSPLSAASLITGTHAVQIWYGGPGKLRLALPVSFGETDLRVNNTEAWLWESQGQRATRFIVSPPHGFAVPGQHAHAALPRRLHPKPAKPGQAPPVPLTPMQAANRFLKLVGPTTRVTVPGTTTVAGRDAYQLSIAPRSNQSLIGRILIAVDSETHLPLSLQVFARGGSGPAFQIGFTSLSFAKPAASNFTFTPPPGAKVKTVHVPPGPLAGAPHGHRLNVPPGALMPPHARHGMLPRMSHLRHGMLPRIRPAFAPQTFGSGWLSVIALPIGPAMTYAGTGGPSMATLAPTQGADPGYSSSLRMSGPAGQSLGLLRVLLKASKPVHGPWGSGRLLRTSLLSVLVTNKGLVLAGAVSPAVLYADAAKAK